MITLLNNKLLMKFPMTMQIQLTSFIVDEKNNARSYSLGEVGIIEVVLGLLQAKLAFSDKI